MKNAILTMLALAVFVPSSAEAQRRFPGAPRANPFSFSPFVGAYKDAYDLEADGSDLGWMVGFKAGYRASDRVAVQATLGYAEANDVGSHVIAGAVYDNEWILLTGGVDFTLVPGATSVSLGGEAGVGWRRTPLQNGDAPGADGWGSYDLIVPALTLRHTFSNRASLFLTAQDMIFDVLEGDAEHSPALILGLSFR